MKSWLVKNGIEIYSKLGEGESVIRTLKSKIYKYMTSVSKNVYIDKSDDIVNKYNNTYHCTFKMKKSNTYIESSKETDNKNSKFKIVDTARISKYQNFVIKNVKKYCAVDIYY